MTALRWSKKNIEEVVAMAAAIIVDVAVAAVLSEVEKRAVKASSFPGGKDVFN